MRPGRAQDLDQYIELWRGEVRAGRQDVVPDEARMRRILARFDWGARSRMVDDGRHLAGAVLLLSRPSPEGVLASMYVAGQPRTTPELVRWALGLSHAAGAAVTQTLIARGRGEGLREAGMHVARPWWRMDRSLGGELPQPVPVPGYQLLDGTRAPARAWADMFNRSFADHWRFTPRTEEEIVDGKPPELCLMAVTSTGSSPAAISFGEVEAYRDDPRPQPVGLISSVGTLPEHRRRGLAGWLVAEVMGRLRNAGARHASLYVDGMNATRAFDLYRELGFEVAFEAEVWEF
jgi:ribosomal protein S18 acetylase RimI-like enzyme